MKRINIFLIIIFTIICGPILTNVLVGIPSPLTNGEGRDWIGFFGNYSGGIIGGVVAYLIARYEIEQYKIEENNKRTFEKEQNRRRLLTQLKFSYEVINNTINQTGNVTIVYEVFKKQD